jgi:hypothetical protein
MRQSVILLTLPLKPVEKPLSSPLFLHIAKYNYHLELEKGDEVEVHDWTIGHYNDHPISFTALVTNKIKRIKPQKDQDIFEIAFILEIGDKDKIPKIVEIIKKLNPGKFEDELY